MRFHTELFREVLQGMPVFVAFAPQDMRVSYAGHHVNNIGVACQNLRQCFDNVFNSLVRRKQSEREQNFFPFGAESVLVKTRIGKRQIGDAVRNQIDLVRGNVKTSCRISADCRLMTIKRSDSVAISFITLHADQELGSRRTVCRVVANGILSRRRSSRICAPARPPKIPYSCCRQTRSMPLKFRKSAACR